MRLDVPVKICRMLPRFPEDPGLAGAWRDAVFTYPRG